MSYQPMRGGSEEPQGDRRANSPVPGPSSLLRAFAFLLILAMLPASLLAAPKVKLGIDVLRERNFEPLAGKRVGLVVNPASVDQNLVSTVDVLRNAPGVRLVALYGPEHGVYGDEYAGDKIDNRTDPATNLPIFSLYGATRKPTPEMLKDIDVLVFDLQDIGSRSYTYISTMKACLEACAEQGKTFVVLDRPNPLGGNRIEGPGLDTRFESFISALPVPYIHGMTMGELAMFTRDLVKPDYQQLVVIPMEGWTRDMIWEDTGLGWIATSPHIPQASSTWAYAATGIAGELMQISNGVGYTLPFEIVGSPTANGDALAAALRKHWSPQQSVVFRPIRFKPFYATHRGEVCQGVQIHLDARTAPSLVEINFRILEAMNAPKIMEAAGKARHDMFDKACGTDTARIALTEARDLVPLFEKWKRESADFAEARKKHLLY